MSTVSSTNRDGRRDGRNRDRSRDRPAAPEFPVIKDPAEFLSMSDDDFNALVEAEVRNQVPYQTAQTLRHPDMAERWYWSLVKLKKSVENQIGAKRSDLRLVQSIRDGEQVWISNECITGSPQERTRAQGEFHRWRSGAIRFKNSVEERMLKLRSHKVTLLQGIARHRDFVLQNYPEDVNEADRKLWSLADQAQSRAS